MKKIVTSTILVFALFIGYSNDLKTFYLNFIKSEKIENIDEINLKKVKNNISIEYIKSLYGTPILKEKSRQSEYTEYIFSQKQYYLQVVFDSERIVHFYAITLRDSTFHPEIPYLTNMVPFIGIELKSKQEFRKMINEKQKKILLGMQSFYEVFDGKSSFIHLYNNSSSKFMAYAESHYLANPGNYQYLYLTYNPAGVSFPDDNWSAFNRCYGYDDCKQYKKETIELRKHIIPNTYAIGDSDINTNYKIIKAFGIGVDYFMTRKLQ